MTLYDGPLIGYGIAVMDLPDDTRVPARSKPTMTGARGAGGATTGRSAGPAYAYLSLVDGKAMRHATWAECERRVKGRSGARFKKATSADDQAEILRAWRVDPGDL